MGDDFYSLLKPEVGFNYTAMLFCNSGLLELNI